MKQAPYTFAISEQFQLDGQPFRILSGAIHYFRVHPDYWRDRLLKLRACGFNTVETYVPWNMHEPTEEAYSFDGFTDIELFIQTAAEVGLKVIVRPGPYICAEWELGGLPAWLGKHRDMRLRCDDPAYLRYVDRWFGVLLPRLVPHLCTNGGPIIAMQIENEYGSYGNDKAYLRHLQALYLQHGIDCPLFTSDGWTELMLKGGTLPEVYKTVNFGSRAKEAFDTLRAVQPDKPPMCMEFWCGWFDHWGEPHHTRDATEIAAELDTMLSEGGSVNMYMFHGGTNFGFYSGANLSPEGLLEPTITSYDYDALLDEAGNTTEKYDACKRVLEKHFGPAPAIEIQHHAAAAFGRVALTEYAPLWTQQDVLSAPVESAFALSMEELGGQYGYVLYSTTLTGPISSLTLTVPSLRDRGHVFLDGARLGILHRDEPAKGVTINVPEGKSARLDILVENQGRVNYGTSIELPKGISGHVKLDYQSHFGWQMRLLPLDTLPSQWTDAAPAPHTPTFLRGFFDVDTPADTYLDFEYFGKGAAFINGFNLGRYWEASPQCRLYIPAPLLRKGRNEVVLFETDGWEKAEISLHDAPKFDV